MTETYEGPVCFQDGWHYSVVPDASGNDTPGVQLFLEDDDTYRTVEAGDESWQARKQVAFTLVVPEDGAPGVAVTAEEMTAIQALLDQSRGGS